MATKADRDVLELLPMAAARVRRAAMESMEIAKKTRANVRRERIKARSMTSVIPPAEPLDMPEEWCEDEDTSKFAVDENLRKK